MRNKIKALGAALVMALAMLAPTAAQPAAAADGDHATAWKCLSYYDIVTCGYIEWSKQADGTGVRLEWIEWRTTQGCDSLEAEGGKYDPVRAGWTEPGGTVNYVWTWFNEPCGREINPSDAGQDNGSMVLSLTWKARVNNRGDKRINIEWQIFPNGGYEVIDTSITDA